MSIFSKIKHAFEKVGHDIEHVAKAAIHDVEGVVKTMEKDVEHILQDTMKMTEALMEGHFKEGLQDFLKVTDDVVKTGTDLATSQAKMAMSMLGDLHISKGLDKFVSGAEKELKTITDDVEKGVDSTIKTLADSTVGIATGSLQMLKDLAHGDLKAAMGDVMKVGEDVVTVAADLTPEGLAVDMASQVMVAAHIGNAKIDDLVAGAMHGNVGEMVKGAEKFAKSEVVSKVEDYAETKLASNPKTAEAASNVLPFLLLAPDVSRNHKNADNERSSHQKHAFA
ncbi:hypothetical protein V8G57_00135 [Collimonas sp. H4R21]|jgi:hypothetical protein|uniref:Uncharacterized protein n=1 Tax=Collimonas rhizosphaerae TaxID=3126357 RepID=A0ABU9PP61_9BURK|nr:hypothetical protein [Collimonas sp. OK412]SFC95884.1 hypothetical protein SAMN04515619_11781 [Collimonas sp. OK412]